jgi:colicin import membrane protein
MPRALKVFKTHLGFYDLIVAAPSMKAAAEAWESDPRLFAQGFAAQTRDPEEIRAALAEPGTVLRRPHGQKTSYQVNPAAIAAPKPGRTQKQAKAKAEIAARQKQAADARAARQAAAKARKDAKTELKEIESQEAALRDKRRRLQKQFHLHSVK